MASAASPYKFLDSYDLEDRGMFFGRERETEVLVADVVLSRLVVLFSKTGTGKTSLINAAVRPALEQRGFATFFVRVRRDPSASARAELARYENIDRVADSSLGDVLAAAVKQLEQPVVVFFDQFEEFFLYLVRDDPDRAHAFVAEVADVYRNESLQAHIVLSMREDFYVELDVFRDHIPTIFHNDSNLRLRWFEREPAREAIVKPLGSTGARTEPALVERLLDDLSMRRGLIEPAQLQIVCDTLWRARSNGVMTLVSYEALAGREASTATIAEQIASRRLAEQFEEFELRDELTAVARLLEPGVLSTDRGTKYVRDVPGLARELPEVLAPLGGEAGLRRLLARLETARLVRSYVRDELPHVELMHDYLVAEPQRLEELRRSVRAIWPRRALARGLIHWDPDRPDDAELTVDLEDVLAQLEDEWAEAARDPQSTVHHLALTSAESGLLLRVALHRGGQGRPAFEAAVRAGAPAWEIVVSALAGPRIEDGAAAIGLLAELGSVDAVGALRDALHDIRLATEAQRALTTIAADTGDAGTLAREALVAYLTGLLADSEQASFALLDLVRMETPSATRALVAALKEPRLAGTAKDALRRAAQSRDPDVAQVASEALGRHSLHPDLPPRPALAPEPGSALASSWPTTPAVKRRSLLSGDVDESELEIIGRRLLSGRMIILLGSEVNDSSGGGDEILPSPDRLARELAERYELEMGADGLPRVAEAVVAEFGERELYELLSERLAGSSSTTAVHHFCASLPRQQRQAGQGQPVIVTTAYDDALERALDAAGEPFELLYWTKDDGRPAFVHVPWDAEPRVILDTSRYTGLNVEARTVVLKPLGSVDRGLAHRSLVVTEDDFLEFVAGLDLASALPLPLAAALGRSGWLFLGCALGRWTERVLVDRIAVRSRSSRTSWAVSMTSEALVRAIWVSRGVRLVTTTDLAPFLSALEQRMRA